MTFLKRKYADMVGITAPDFFDEVLETVLPQSLASNHEYCWQSSNHSQTS